MRTSTIFAAGTLVASALAAPSPRGYGGWGNRGGRGWGKHGQNGNADVCLTDGDALAAADIFRHLIQEYSDELALDALTEDFVDWTSAVAIIRNRGAELPFIVNEILFDGRQAFMDAQGSQPQIPFETLNVFHGCNSTTVRWQTTRSANGQKTETADIPVVGIAILETVPDADNSYGFRVKTLFSEFNAAAWLVNNGVFKPNGTFSPVGVDPTPAPKPAKRAVFDDSLRGPAI
nr:hypothetical protein B0A51_00632 [Rachicladosporium sp. CCFEE 5018]